MKRLCAALLIPLAAACAATLDHEKVEGWPQLQVFEHYVSHADMRTRCSRYVGFGTAPVACAEFNLPARRCDIWYSADFPPSREIVQHERLHCAGYDHIGSYAMKEVLARHGQVLAGRSGTARSN
jgi:hypothetical protein